MATTSNILTLLKFYANKQQNAMIEYDEFADYVHRYAQHHLEENSDLVIYCGSDYYSVLEGEITELVGNKQAAIGNIRNKDYIFVVSYLIEKYFKIYKQIEQNISVPFPCVADIPKLVPMEILTKQPALDIIYRFLDKQELDDKFLYSLIFEKTAPALLFPSSYPVTNLLELALKKIQELLKKGETHDYFLKKLTISNPGKEIACKSFFSAYVSNPLTALEVIKESGETFYYWSQLCYFLKQDYTKVKDFTPEDVSILQSVAIIETCTSYYKSKAAERIAKENAFKVLDTQMQNPPYYFNMADVRKIKDSNGQLLLDQYTEEDLKNHLYNLTQETVGNQLPELLVFKVNEDEAGFYIHKEKVMSLIIHLTNDARVVIKEGLSKTWYKQLADFETLPEMKENGAFERCLEREIRTSSPILYSILNSSFLAVIAFEDKTPGKIMLFRDGALVPYSELLMISRHEIYNDAKIKLPIWYSLPIISWIMSLIMKKPKNKKGSNKNQSAAMKLTREQQEKEREELKRRDEDDSFDSKNNRKRELRKAAAAAEKHYVPETSTLDRELEGYCKEWNDRIGKQNYDNLTEDVNSLIRDYIRKTLRTLKSESFTPERISNLADRLVDSPSMMKIKNHPALKRYIELYLVKIVKNLP